MGNATIVSWTRNNVLRHEYSLYMVDKTDNGYSNHLDKHATKTFIPFKWIETSLPVMVNTIIATACDMLAIRSAFSQCTDDDARDHQIVYEDFANDPMATL